MKVFDLEEKNLPQLNLFPHQNQIKSKVEHFPI